jgi:hypothetical protein
MPSSELGKLEGESDRSLSAYAKLFACYKVKDWISISIHHRDLELHSA